MPTAFDDLVNRLRGICEADVDGSRTSKGKITVVQSSSGMILTLDSLTARIRFVHGGPYIKYEVYSSSPPVQMPEPLADRVLEVGVNRIYLLMDTDLRGALSAGDCVQLGLHIHTPGHTLNSWHHVNYTFTTGQVVRTPHLSVSACNYAGVGVISLPLTEIIDAGQAFEIIQVENDGKTYVLPVDRGTYRTVRLVSDVGEDMQVSLPIGPIVIPMIEPLTPFLEAFEAAVAEAKAAKKLL